MVDSCRSNTRTSETSGGPASRDEQAIARGGNGSNANVDSADPLPPAPHTPRDEEGPLNTDGFPALPPPFPPTPVTLDALRVILSEAMVW